MSAPACKACSEYMHLSRRSFLRVGGGAAVLAAVGAPAWLPRVAYAHPGSPSARDVLIVVFLRGGADGLTLCAPAGESAYYTHRPKLAIKPDTPGVKDLDGFFILPPGMAALHEAYKAKHLAVVHAAGSIDPTRSHFDAMKFMESGKPGDISLITGWLGRHLATTPPSRADAVVRAIAVGEAVQMSLVGAPMSAPVPDMANYGLDGDTRTTDARKAAMGDIYAAADALLKTASENTIRTMDLLEAIDFYGYQPGGGAVYPDSYFGYSLKSAAALIRAQVGVEAVALDAGGWDTHALQGPVDGSMNDLMKDLSGALAAFHADIVGGSTHRTVVVVMSEFGRRVAENGSDGTDHGHGNCMFVMGQQVSGGRVISEWPGLEDLYEDLDLKVTIDYRDVLAEILSERIGNRSLADVFPGYTPKFRGVTHGALTKVGKT